MNIGVTNLQKLLCKYELDYRYNKYLKSCNIMYLHVLCHVIACVSNK